MAKRKFNFLFEPRHKKRPDDQISDMKMTVLKIGLQTTKSNSNLCAKMKLMATQRCQTHPQSKTSLDEDILSRIKKISSDL